MIRFADRADAATVRELAVSSGLFAREHAGIVDRLMADYFAKAHAEGHGCVLDVGDVDGAPIAAAYFEPAPATSGTAYLTLIAVDPPAQGRGRGSALLSHVERLLATRGERVLLVQTSGAYGYARTRRFYAKSGYEEEARVRDYYAAGEDMVLFRKSLR